MSKGERTGRGGVLASLDMLLYDVFAPLAARMWEANWGQAANRTPNALGGPTAKAPRASSQVGGEMRAPARVATRRPRVA